MEKEVNLYVTPKSTDTDKIKDYLESENIDYQVVDVHDDFKAHKRMLEATRGACGAPVVEIGHQIVCGFDSERLKETLDYELR
jgi:glutaredoxin 3